MDMNKRKELIEEYKQIKIYMGVAQIKNQINGKIFIDSYPNLKNKWLTLQMQLDSGDLQIPSSRRIGKNSVRMRSLMRY